MEMISELPGSYSFTHPTDIFPLEVQHFMLVTKQSVMSNPDKVVYPQVFPVLRLIVHLTRVLAITGQEE